MLTSLLLVCLQSGQHDQALAEAAALAQQGRFESAVAKLESLADSGDASVLAAMGTYLLRDAEAKAASGRISGDTMFMAFDEAARTLERATKTTGAPADAFVSLSEALINLEEVDSALKAVEAGRKKHADSVDLALQHGRVYTAKANVMEGLPDKQQEAWMSARKVLRGAKSKFSDNAAVCVRLGEVEVYLKNLSEAQAAWKEALKRDSQSVDVGAMIQWIGNDNAIKVLRGHQTATGEDGTMLWWQAYCEYSAQPRQWTDAKKNFQRALKLQPEFANSWFFLGEGAMQAASELTGDARAREYAFAAKAWGNYLELYGPTHLQGVRQMEDGGKVEFETKSWLAGKAYEKGDRKSAYSLAKWVASGSPDDSAAWNNYAFFSRETGKDEESLQAYRKAAELSPEDPQILNDMALILHYNLKRDLDEAERLYARAIELAEKMLETPDEIPEDQIGFIRVALRDARNNLSLLKQRHGG